jgi:hypothetical protein
MLVAVLIVGLGTLPRPLTAGKVQVFVPKNQSFSQYHTFSWLPIRILAKTGVVEDDTRVSPVIRKAITERLVKAGLTEVPENGDLQIISIALQQSNPQLEALVYQQFVAYNSDWIMGVPITAIGRYNREGTLAVSLDDPKTKKSVWAGYIVKDLGGSLDNDVNGAVNKLFKKLPPMGK